MHLAGLQLLSAAHLLVRTVFPTSINEKGPLLINFPDMR